MKKILNIVCAVLAVLLLCGGIGGVVYLLRDQDEPVIDEPSADYVAVEQIILNEEGIIF